MATRKRAGTDAPETPFNRKNDSATTEAASTRPSEVFDSAKYNAMSDMTQGASLDAKNVNTLANPRETEMLEPREISDESVKVERQSNHDNIQTSKITPMTVEERARTIRAVNEDIQQTTSDYDKFVMYLNLALSIENAVVERLHMRILQSPLSQVRQQFYYHLEETREQKERLISLIRRLGGQPTGERAELASYSPPKSLADVIDASATAEEQELKMLGIDTLIEHVEVIGYNTLIQMAVKMGIGEAIPALRQNLQEEEDMVAWARANLPSYFIQLWEKI